MPVILFVNACVRGQSRTMRLAKALLNKLGGEEEEIRLHEVDFPVADEDFLSERDRLIAQEKWEHTWFSMARQFAAADQIVKQYFEQINVLGITFVYTPEGIPRGLCKARKLYYVTTAGGNYVPWEFGYGYVKALAQGYYGIPETELIQAAGLDIDGADEEEILKQALNQI